MIAAGGLRPHLSGTLKGFIDGGVSPSGLALISCTLHEKVGKSWLALPGKPQLDELGKQSINAWIDRRLFTPTVGIRYQARKRFQGTELAIFAKPQRRERAMTPLDAALEYAAAALPVFPCREREPCRRKPYTPRGFYDASLDPAIISQWWQSWPNALIGMPTGRVSGRVVFDIDVKRPEANGFDSLEDLGHVVPSTPIAHTPSGGLHCHLDAGERELRNSAGQLGAGLDVRGDGGYAILPSPGSGYAWDPIYNFGTCALAPAPDWLWPPKLSRPIPNRAN
jgi:Bifunctional DNA primase/polymerase, N-terminal